MSEHSGNKYLRPIFPREAAGGRNTPIVVDVYNVLEAFGVTCPAIAHAVKKLLCAGLRGKAGAAQDIVEARDAISRAIELATQRKAPEDETAARVEAANEQDDHP